ncbi:MAG: DEAD/DEAH box helicase, partial [Pseudomonadota bacterium]|nr:DEAD/DEAH box helicase [Pseudomonadota bacterium]
MIPEPQANSSPLVWVIAVPSPLHRVFEYLPPSDTQITPQPGARVKVSFSGRDIIGIFLEQRRSELPPATVLKRAEMLLDSEVPLLGTDQLQLLWWLSDYYLIPQGEALQLGLATLERKGRPVWTAEPDHIALKQGTAAIDKLPTRASKQRAAAQFIGEHTVPIDSLTKEGFSVAVISALIKSGVAEKKRAEPTAYSPHPTVILTDAQRQICSTLKAQMTGFKPHLLEGVTGSGKTEIYIECIKAVIARGHQVLVIIPEIGLTPQTKHRFEAALGCEVPIIHSGLTEAERGRTWAMARSGVARVVLGTRSSVFCSFQALGLIIVDEEHDPSFKQQDHPRYSARDVAVKRAQICNCPIIMGSATPSLDTIANCDQGRYQHHALMQRPHG